MAFSNTAPTYPAAGDPGYGYGPKPTARRRFGGLFGGGPATTTGPAITTGTRTSSAGDMCLYLFAILVPPLAVFFRTGCGADFLINICLTILAWIPGILHAWWVISRSSRTAVI